MIKEKSCGNIADYMRKILVAGSFNDNLGLSGESSDRNIEKMETQPCPCCGFRIGIVAGTKDAICTNCGFKDPCCD